MHSFQNRLILVTAFFTLLIGMTTTGCDRGTPINIGSDPCDVSACGTAPEAKYTTCADGSQAGPTGQCLKTSSGSCAWEYSTCAAACSTGATKTADDGCNQCTCTKSGEWACTNMSCSQTCSYQGVTYAEGTTFESSAGCCTCSAGDVKCSTAEIACATSCEYEGKTYAHGAAIQLSNSCNGCFCNYGQVSCITLLDCPNPTTCVETDCGAKPHSVPTTCADGSTGGYTGLCLRDANSTCSWEFRNCPESKPCSDAECGNIPQSAAYQCPDGSLGGNTGKCLRDANGTCRWEIRDCPTTCTYEGKPYDTGSSFPSTDGCNTCSCKDGNVVCTTNACPNPNPCTEAECGSRPKCATYQCADGSMAGCTDKCLRDANGVCGWEILECPDPKPCEDVECSEKPKPDCGTYQCEDGSIAGCTGKCLRDANGVCGWEARPCPTACKTLGEVVILNDTCQQCTCTVDGNWTCKDADPTMCNTDCYVDGVTYPNGAQFSSGGNCCTCQNGKAACILTQMYCPGTCTYNGKLYNTGDSYPAVNGCDSCTCNNGINTCTSKPSCSASYVCDVSECKGDMPSGAAFQCPDGSLGGVTGWCLREVTSASGACSWEVRKCSVDCKPGDQTLTADGCGTCVCGADLGWTCTEGKCAVCPAGDPRFIEGGCPACTVGKDQTCNDEPMNSLAGSCIRNVCSCNEGFGINPQNGKCKVSTATANSVCIPTFNPNGYCNGNLQTSYREGQCLFDGTCQCLTSYVLDSATGKCVFPVDEVP